MMVEEQYVNNITTRLKKGIAKELGGCHIEMGLELISNCAKLLYDTGLYYVDEDLESALKEVSLQLNLQTITEAEDDVVLFYDGFGLDDRGLAQIYTKSLGQIKNLVYVTYAGFKDRIPAIKKTVEDNQGKVLYIGSNALTFKEQIKALNDIVAEVKPGHFFFYSCPNDVVATTLMNAYENHILRYQVNLTDHAFWLGARCIDKCIEFRDYGASISRKYRKIPEAKIVKLPFHPELHMERGFMGFPFDVKGNQKVIFSGGALYKTLSPDNKFYQIVDHILDSYKDVIFWYAGSGDDSELEKILKKYPGRAYHTQKRQDLYQVIRNCRLVLSTYPLSDGLMLQFAACAGRVPVTLYRDEGDDGFLLNQKSLGIEFHDSESLYREVEKLLYDDNYFKIREQQMLSSVTSEKNFTEGLRDVISGDYSSDGITYEDIKTGESRHLNLEKLSERDINSGLVCNSTVGESLKHSPFEFMTGGKNDDGKGNSHKVPCEVSVIVLCYNPKPDALKFTLDSIIGQQDVEFEIVISDDGSADNLYETIKLYFAEKHFNCWKFVYNERNNGTVCNLYSALSASEGCYIKDISPGDALSRNDVIRKWIDFLKENGCRWSFSDAVYYTRKENDIEYITGRAHPGDIKPYLEKNTVTCRWNYAALNDVALGAAMLSERKTLTDYCERILNKVIYAEDNVFRMMMFDGIVACYFPCNTVLYEYGTGISTVKNDVWSARLDKDWEVANKVMAETGNLDAFQKSIIKAWTADTKLKKLFVKGKLKKAIYGLPGLYRRTENKV